MPNQKPTTSGINFKIKDIPKRKDQGYYVDWSDWDDPEVDLMLNKAIDEFNAKLKQDQEEIQAMDCS